VIDPSLPQRLLSCSSRPPCQWCRPPPTSTLYRFLFSSLSFTLPFSTQAAARSAPPPTVSVASVTDTSPLPASGVPRNLHQPTNADPQTPCSSTSSPRICLPVSPAVPMVPSSTRFNSFLLSFHHNPLPFPFRLKLPQDLRHRLPSLSPVSLTPRCCRRQGLAPRKLEFASADKCRPSDSLGLDVVSSRLPPHLTRCANGAILHPLQSFLALFLSHSFTLPFSTQAATRSLPPPLPTVSVISVADTSPSPASGVGPSEFTSATSDSLRLDLITSLHTIPGFPISSLLGCCHDLRYALSSISFFLESFSFY
jgi:hypothetical protein